MVYFVVFFSLFLPIITGHEFNLECEANDKPEFTMNTTEDKVLGRYRIKWCSLLPTPYIDRWVLAIYNRDVSVKDCEQYRITDKQYIHSRIEQNIHKMMDCVGRVCITTDIDLIFTGCYTIHNEYYLSMNKRLNDYRLRYITSDIDNITMLNEMKTAFLTESIGDKVMVKINSRIPLTDYHLKLCYDDDCKFIENSCSVTREENDQIWSARCVTRPPGLSFNNIENTDSQGANITAHYSDSMSKTEPYSGGMSKTEPNSGGMSKTAPNSDGTSKTETYSHSISKTESNSGGMSKTDSNSYGTSITAPNSGGMSKTDFNSYGMSKTAPNSGGVSKTDSNSYGMSKTAPNSGGMSKTTPYSDSVSSIPDSVMANLEGVILNLNALLIHTAPWTHGALFDSSMKDVYFNFTYSVPLRWAPLNPSPPWWGWGGLRWAWLAGGLCSVIALLLLARARYRSKQYTLALWKSRYNNMSSPPGSGSGAGSEAAPILLLYARDAPPFMQAVQALRQALQDNHAGEVLDIYSCEVTALCAGAPAAWLQGLLARHARVLLLQGPAAAATQALDIDSQHRVMPPVSASGLRLKGTVFGDSLFQLALRSLSTHHDRENAYKLYFIANVTTIEEATCELVPLLCPYRRYWLPAQLSALVAHLAPSIINDENIVLAMKHFSTYLQYVSDNPDYLQDLIDL